MCASFFWTEGILVYSETLSSIAKYTFFGSINGENVHYGTPTNPCATDRVPGGSSSGSAVAVGAMLADFSLGEIYCSLESLYDFRWLSIESKYHIQ